MAPGRGYGRRRHRRWEGRFHDGDGGKGIEYAAASWPFGRCWLRRILLLWIDTLRLDGSSGRQPKYWPARSRSHRADTSLWSSRQASRPTSSDSLPIQVSRPVFAWRCPASEAVTAQSIAFWPRAVLANGVIQ